MKDGNMKDLIAVGAYVALYIVSRNAGSARLAR